MKRSGGWILALVVVAAMGAGGWFALRRVLSVETVTVAIMGTDDASAITLKALSNGAQTALKEAGGRAGRFRIQLMDHRPGTDDYRACAAWIGSSEAMMMMGDWQPAALHVAAFDVAPWETAASYHLTPGPGALGAAALRWARKSKAARIVLIRDESVHQGVAIANGFAAAAKEAGIEIVLTVPWETPTLADQVLAARADLVFFSGEDAPYSTASKIFARLREKGFAGPLVTGEADPEISFLATRPSLVEGSYLVSPFAPSPTGKTTGPHITAGYFAMKAVLDALERADSVEDLQAAMNRIPYFDADRRAALRPCAIYVARNGIYEFVEELK